MAQVLNDIANIVKNSKFFNEWGYKYEWTSGSTSIPPISFWGNNNELKVLISPRRTSKRIDSARVLVEQISGITPVKNWYIVANDGSCPDELRIYLETIKK